MAVVETSVGQLRGTAAGGIRTFLGIPYAEPPLGPRRFRAPAPYPPWAGVRDAMSFGLRAVQTPINPADPPQDPGHEDCLYLNVWAPDRPGPHPVLFWVHGGAFVMGSGNDADGRALAEEGLVVVTVNYRIGPFGYLYLGDIAPGLTDTNLALRDLALALDWTRANIASFGGDADRIVLAGQSSGAMMVGAMLGAPSCRGKYRAAWLMSGAARQVRSRELATRSAEMFLDAAGVSPAEVARVPDLPTAVLTSASGVLASYSQHDEQFDAEVMLPVVGDDVLPDHPMDAIRRGASRETRILVSWTLKDMGLFRIFDAENGGRNKELFARRLLGDQCWEELARTYRSGGDDWYVDLLTDFHFSIPARRLAEAQLQAGGRSWVARFDRAPVTPPWEKFGPVHTCDLFYLWTPLSPPVRPITDIGAGSGMLAEDRALSRAVRGVVAGLAADDELTAGAKWPEYDLASRATLLFDDPVRVVNDPDSRRRSAWDRLLE
jgi:para-nitrobenzyl esterase